MIWHDLLATYSSSTVMGESPRIVLATNATFSSAEFQSRLRCGPHLLIVGDEMHRLGSKRNLACLRELKPGGTLGLSATYSRQFR